MRDIEGVEIPSEGAIGNLKVSQEGAECHGLRQFASKKSGAR